MKSEMRAELRSLFGEPIVYFATKADPATLELSAALIDRVHDGADALLMMRGRMDEQRRYISGLPFDVRLVLCMWIGDTELATRLIRATAPVGANDA